MQPLQRLRDSGSSATWVAIPMVVLGAWALSAQAPGASQADLERRVAELEARLLKGPGNSTRIQAPFEVLDASGSVVLRVAQARSGAAAVEIYRGTNQVAIEVNRNGKQLAGLGALGQKGMVFAADNEGPRAVLSGEGEVVVIDENGNEVANMEANAKGGRVAVGTSADSGGTAVLEVDENGGGVSIRDLDGSEVASLSVDPESGFGSLRIGDDSADIAILGGTKQKAGVLDLWSSAGKVAVKVMGGTNGGGVMIGNAQGLNAMELLVDADGVGKFQVYRGGGRPSVVLTRNDHGGILQIFNSAGVNVGNFQIGAGNSGYLQLTDAAGTAVVEAGGAPGYGVVRVGPLLDCTPRPLKNPTCLVGKLTP